MPKNIKIYNFIISKAAKSAIYNLIKWEKWLGSKGGKRVRYEMGGVSDYFCAHKYRSLSLSITESAHLLLLETGILRGETEGEELNKGSKCR